MYQTRTKIRSISRRNALKSELKKQKGVLLLDEGVQFPEQNDWKNQPFLSLPGGEQVKTWNNLGICLEFFSHEKLERSSTLVAVGGGATLDLAAFAASLYRRGMKLILIPSTLLGMVDASIGGKTAVDREGKILIKNFAGTFYFADEVWICPFLMETLPKRERISGSAELWKMLWISGSSHENEVIFQYINQSKISKKFSRYLSIAVNAKNKIVQKDPFDERRIREVLNYGHTVGHILESISRGKLTHGEAVLWGMAIESRIFGSSIKFQKNIDYIIQKLQLKLPSLKITEQEFLARLLQDKKMKQGKLECSYVKTPKKCVRKRISPEVLARKFISVLEFYRREGKRLLM